jgi:hypothetical protein
MHSCSRRGHRWRKQVPSRAQDLQDIRVLRSDEMKQNEQFGPRSTGQDGIPQPTLLSILMGRLYPSTTDTAMIINFGHW